MSRRPPVAAVMPVRDAADTLLEAVDSLLSQRGADLELIAVEDGSADQSPRLLDMLAKRHRQVRVLRTGGVGIPGALNSGIMHTSAELVMRMDADDVCEPDRLKRQLEELVLQPDIAALGSRVSLIPAETIADGMRAYVAWQHSLTTQREHANQLFVESPLCHPSVLMRRAAWAAVGGYRAGPFPEDYDMWLRLDATGFGLAKVAESLLRWRQGPDRATLRDPRYGVDRFLACKAPFVARRLLATGPGTVIVWGAGRTGKRLMRALEPHGIDCERFVDIDPRKIGRTARGVPIDSPECLRRRKPGRILVAVGARGARDQVRDHLDRLGYRDGSDYLCCS